MLLGAGFSRAVSDHMPLTDELGGEVIQRLHLHDDRRVPSGGFHGGGFERWLSHLATEQPFLTTQKNLENHALFLRVSEAVAKVLGENVQATLTDPWPQWLPEMVRTAHWQRSTIVTFNYDTLIECAVASHLLYEWEALEPVFWTETIQDVPNWPPGSARWAATRADTFRLLKLHGSLNWYWTPGDETGTSVARRELPGRFGEPRPYTEQDRRRELPGRVPFVVPPSTSKSAFYRNPLLRDVWQQAYKELHTAGRLVLIGYSLPLTDLTVVDMLSETTYRQDVPIVVVDPRASDVAGRLTQLGVVPERITCVHGSKTLSAAETFVSEWVCEAGVQTAHRLSSMGEGELDIPLLVIWDKTLAAAVVEVTHATAETFLVTDPPSEPNSAIGGSGTRRGRTLPVLRDAVKESGSGRSLRVWLPDGSCQTVIGCSVAAFNHGYGTGRWHVLYTSGPAPDSAVTPSHS